MDQNGATRSEAWHFCSGDVLSKVGTDFANSNEGKIIPRFNIGVRDRQVKASDFRSDIRMLRCSIDTNIFLFECPTKSFYPNLSIIKN